MDDVNSLLRNVYVINMDKDTERMHKISRNLQEYGIKYKRVSAIEGKKLSPKELHENTTALCRAVLCTKGIIGSGMSHMNVWKTIAESKEKWHLILEDDVEFNKDSIRMLENLNNHLQNNDIEALINVNCHNPYEMFCTFYSFSDLLSNNFFAAGASAYLITPTIAKQLLSHTQGRVYGFIDSYLALTLHGDTPKYLVTKERYVKHDFDLYKSNNMQVNMMPITSFIISKLGLQEIAFFFNVPLINIYMSYEINVFTIIFFGLLVWNIIYLQSPYLALFLLIEFTMYIFIIVKKKAHHHSI
jgi:GR25 family glycosyltransferase involved in LPS biosynthesis